MRFTDDKRGADPMSYDNSGHHYSDCTGPGGCDCDERRYGYRGGGGGGGNTGCLWLIAVVILSIIGVWNELIALILLFIVAAVLLLSR